MTMLHDLWLAVCKWALGPVLLLQARWVRRTALRLPEPCGPRSGVLSGAGPELRVLFVGDSSAAGVGVADQSEALAYQVCDLISRRTGRCVRWQLVARSGVNTREAIDLVEGHPLAPAHVVVSALGVNDVTSQTGTRRFVENYRMLIHVLSARTGASFSIVTGLPPLHVLAAAPQPLRWYLGQWARRFDVALCAFCRENTACSFISLQWARACDMAADKFHPGKSQYQEWARLVAARILQLNP